MTEPVIFTVDRAKSARVAIEELVAGGWRLYGDLSILATAPASTGTEVKLDLFRAGVDGNVIPSKNVQGEYTERNLVVDLQALTQYAQAHPDFADTYPVGMEWEDTEGKYCYLAFDHCNGVLVVGIERDYDGWDKRCMFAGCGNPSDTQII